MGQLLIALIDRIRPNKDDDWQNDDDRGAICYHSN